MKRKRYSEEQIAFCLRQHEAGTPIEQIIRKMGISEQTFYRWKKKFAGLSAADYATLVGVSGLTIYNWEHGKSRPRPQQLASLVALRGLGKRQARVKLESLNGAVKNGSHKRGPRKKRR